MQYILREPLTPCHVRQSSLRGTEGSYQSRLDSHLYTAVSIYLLLGLLWFALYSSITSLYPNAILSSQRAIPNRPSELLYFSLATLTTLGYGDVVAANSEVRILAVLEAVTGVLYVAITVAILVSSYRRLGSRAEPGTIVAEENRLHGK